MTKVYSQGARVKAFEKCGCGWRWPKQVDEYDYLPQDIVQKIEFPEPFPEPGNLQSWEY